MGSGRESLGCTLGFGPDHKLVVWGVWTKWKPGQAEATIPSLAHYCPGSPSVVISGTSLASDEISDLTKRREDAATYCVAKRTSSWVLDGVL